jgi:tRNA modification GTPase
LDDNRRGEIIREGVQIALVGQPNAGKSSLMNALARRPAAIVSPIAGTTRDIVEVRMDIDGISCIVRDTAGLRNDTDDPIEQEGIRRAREALDQSQIRIFVLDLSSKDTIETALQLYRTHFGTSPDIATNEPFRKLLVCNKIDLMRSSSGDDYSLLSNSAGLQSLQLKTGLRPFYTSCIRDEGLKELEDGIKNEIETLLQQPSSTSSTSTEGVLITRERHRGHIKRCIRHLDRFLQDYLPMDAAAEELRLAMMEIGKVTGRVDVEELLDIIFRDFCIGK